MHIREAVAQESAPATLKAAFLEPVLRSLATDLSVHLFARTDQQFMSWFTCEALDFNLPQWPMCMTQRCMQCSGQTPVYRSATQPPAALHEASSAFLGCRKVNTHLDGEACSMMWAYEG
jgi:hypothetical protein